MIAALLARDGALTVTGGVMLIGFAVAAVASMGDRRLILGVNPWLKPMKFFASVAIFLLTAAWFMAETRPSPWALALVRWTFVVTMCVELGLICLQAARGTTSHFNEATPFDAVVFAVMGVAITINTVAAAGLLWLIRLDTPPVRAGYLWGVRLGLALFIIGSLLGFLMVARKAHTVPAPDGGPGLPFVNWSTTRGDLRIAHFVGLHALQALPLVGFVLDRTTRLTAPERGTLVLAVAVMWLLAVGGLWRRALRGRPLVAL